ncbi:MAG: M28 family peptidase [Phormidesmis sp. RL_2_1]|nr:M28 family peptidase [Phormidesmis sp. RL_2_1]
MQTITDITQQLDQHLHGLIGPRDPYLNSGRHHLAQQYIRTELSQWGQLTCQSFFCSGHEHFNWQVVIPGKQPTLAPILIGAHYDTVIDSPGADDNASGVAVLLVLAEILFKNPPRRPIHLIAFDLEEYGLIGSLTCAQTWHDQQRPLHLMLSLEMLGYYSSVPHSQTYPVKLLSRVYPNTGDFVALIGDIRAIPHMMRMKRCLRRADAPCEWLPVIHQGRQLPDTRRSDHAPFWDRGYRAILVTDTANLRNPHYHSPSDKLETLDINAMAKATQGLATSLREM